MRGTFTKTNTRDGAKKELRRQPRKQGSVNVNYSFLDKFNINVDDTIVGNSRDGTDGGGITPRGRPTIRTNTGVHKLDTALTYDYSEHFQLYTRAENVLNIQYDEILGFRAAGARFFFGVKLSM